MGIVAARPVVMTCPFYFPALKYHRILDDLRCISENPYLAMERTLGLQLAMFEYQRGIGFQRVYRPRVSVKMLLVEGSDLQKNTLW